MERLYLGVANKEESPSSVTLSGCVIQLLKDVRIQILIQEEVL